MWQNCFWPRYLSALSQRPEYLKLADKAANSFWIRHNHIAARPERLLLLPESVVVDNASFQSCLDKDTSAVRKSKIAIFRQNPTIFTPRTDIVNLDSMGPAKIPLNAAKG